MHNWIYAQDARVSLDGAKAPLGQGGNMKLCFSPFVSTGQVAICEAGIEPTITLRRVDLNAKCIEDGTEFRTTPPLRISGGPLTDIATILPILVDQVPMSRPDDQEAHYDVPAQPNRAQEVARLSPPARLAYLNSNLTQREYLLGDFRADEKRLRKAAYSPLQIL